jgi:hypothetical protein
MNNIFLIKKNLQIFKFLGKIEKEDHYYFIECQNL